MLIWKENLWFLISKICSKYKWDGNLSNWSVNKIIIRWIDVDDIIQTMLMCITNVICKHIIRQLAIIGHYLNKWQYLLSRNNWQTYFMNFLWELYHQILPFFFLNNDQYKTDCLCVVINFEHIQERFKISVPAYTLLLTYWGYSKDK